MKQGMVLCFRWQLAVPGIIDNTKIPLLNEKSKHKVVHNIVKNQNKGGLEIAGKEKAVLIIIKGCPAAMFLSAVMDNLHFENSRIKQVAKY